MARKVTRKIYLNIKKQMNQAVAKGMYPSHKEQKRSSVRHDWYLRIAKNSSLSYETIQKIGRAKSYPNFIELQKHPKTFDQAVSAAFDGKPLGVPQSSKVEMHVEYAPPTNFAEEMQDFIDQMIQMKRSLRARGLINRRGKLSQKAIDLLREAEL